MANPKVRIIEASKGLRAQTERHGAPVPARRLRVAAYCRVSTNQEEQESSYETQCRYYKEKILSSP